MTKNICFCLKIKSISKKFLCVVGSCFEIGCNAPMIIQETGKIGNGFKLLGLQGALKIKGLQ